MESRPLYKYKPLEKLTDIRILKLVGQSELNQQHREGKPSIQAHKIGKPGNSIKSRLRKRKPVTSSNVIKSKSKDRRASKATTDQLPFRCRIEHVDLATANFQALSYVWGEPIQNYWIEIEDEHGKSIGWIALTNNLHSAINDLWRSGEIESKVFWIDQICIDQGNLSENAAILLVMLHNYTGSEIIFTQSRTRRIHYTSMKL
jgi:hypothetical protein